MNILITNIGRRGYLVDYIKQIPDMSVKVFTSDCDVTASGLYGENDGHFILPRPADDELQYVEALLNVCKCNSIDAVLPVIDPEIYILSHYVDVFKENKVAVLVSNRSVLDICFNKLSMNTFLSEIGVHYPMTYSSIHLFETALKNGAVSFPVVLKPVLGSGSVDTYFLNDLDKLKALYHEGMIVQEKINGVEYGTDTFNSLYGDPLRCVIKRKISMRSGETDKSISIHNQIIQETLLHIARSLRHIGNLDCDVIVKDGIPYVIDMNPRFGGGYPATHAIGINLIEILLKLLNGEKVEPEFGNYKENILVMKTIGVQAVDASFMNI